MTENVEAANLKLCRDQKIQRESLGDPDREISLVIHVSKHTNPEGQYVASVSNPILSCRPGFGSTPYRALRELGKNIADNADRILQTIVEHEMEVRVMESSLRVDSER